MPCQLVSPTFHEMEFCKRRGGRRWNDSYFRRLCPDKAPTYEGHDPDLYRFNIKLSRLTPICEDLAPINNDLFRLSSDLQCIPTCHRYMLTSTYITTYTYLYMYTEGSIYIFLLSVFHISFYNEHDFGTTPTILNFTSCFGYWRGPT